MESVIWYGLVSLFGASMGSFITMLVYRMHKKVPIGTSRSRCPECTHALKWFELIPLLSFLFLKGTCGNCHKKIPVRYFLIEFATTVLYLYAWYSYIHSSHPSVVVLLRDWLVIFVAVFTFAYDILYLEVSMGITIGGGILVAILSLIYLGSDWMSVFGGIFVGVGWFGTQYVISHGRWIGGGDIMIGFFMGASLGLWKTIVALGCAYIIGGSWGLALLLSRRKQRKDQIAFGTFLTIGTLIALWWGSEIVAWYGSVLK